MSRSTSPSTADYRPDIDGLRAIAVLAVILFHIQRTWLPGGFYGVDVFFVVSGYLITGNLLRAQASGRFSYAAFLAGRVKRLAPALLAVVGASVLAAIVLLRPEDTVNVATSALWSIASAANIYFWLFTDSSYFAPDSNELPLLHLWSLGVEEQFYLLWPPLLLALQRLRSGALVLVAGVAAASFALHELPGEGLDPNFLHYTLPARGGALLLGCLLALWRFERPAFVPSRGHAEATGWVGLACVLAACIWLKDSQAHAGLRALLPTLGTTLLLFAGLNAAGFAARLLALPPLVAIGRWSYSAYLWHWPLLAYWRYGHADVSVQAGLAMLALTLLLAFLSYRLLEQPLRHAVLGARQAFLRMLVLPGGALAAVCAVALAADGNLLHYGSDEYAQRVRALRADADAVTDFAFVCQHDVLAPRHLQEARCVTGAPATAPTTAPTVLLWGDSNAAHYVGMVSVFARAAGVRVRNVAHAGCPPVFADPTPFVSRARRDDCRASLPLVHAALPTYDVVILAASWNNYDYNSRRFRTALGATLERLSRDGKQVLLLGRVPTIPGLDRWCAEKALHYPGVRCRVQRARVNTRVAQVNDALRRLAARTPNTDYFDANALLCPKGVCNPLDAQRRRLFLDANHLSMRGSVQLGERVLRTQGLPPLFDALAAR